MDIKKAIELNESYQKMIPMLVQMGCISVCLWGAALADVETSKSPQISAGLGYYCILPNKILLASMIQADNSSVLTCKWSLLSGPGSVVFERPNDPITYAMTAVPGKYVFKITAGIDPHISEAQTTVNVYAPGAYTGNPILPGMFPDPHVLYDNGQFYIYATSMENSDGAYGRASVWISEDFINWQMKLTNWPVYGKFNGDIWAPDIIKNGDRYYQFITRSGGYDTWVAVAEHPEGPWKNLRENNTPLVSGGGNAGRIVAAYNMDSNPFIDDDGQAYMYWGWSEAMAARLTPDFRDIDGPVVFLKGTKWLPDGGSLPQWLTVDLGESVTVTRIVTRPEFRHVTYGYKIEISDNNKDWTIWADRTVNPARKAGDGYIDIAEGKGRYVRITMTACEGNWAGLYSFDVFSGDKLVSRNKTTMASSVRGKGSEPANAVDDSDGPYLSDFVEGSYLIKRNGIYYLLYSTGALHDGSYSVHYAMAKHPLGPFMTPADNIVLEMNEEKTTKGPGHNSVLKFNDQYYIVYHQHNQPHEEAGGVFRQTCADRMKFNADGTIKKVIPTQTGVGPLNPLKDQGVDVARGKYARATGVKNGYYCAEYALDHNFASKWRAADNTYPQTLTVDLGGTYDIGRIETSFEYPTLSYTYAIETSLEGKKWDIYADKTMEFPMAVSPHIDTGRAQAAFVRIVIKGCQRPENGAGIYTLKVFEK